MTEKKGFSSKEGIEGEMRAIIHQSEGILKEIHDVIETTIHQTSESIKTTNLIGSLLIALVVIGFALYLSLNITRTLEGFIRTLKNISETGNLTLRVDEKGHDEIAEVGTTFNAMLADFQEIVKRLHIASADLTQYSLQFMTIRDATFSNVEKQQMETEQVSTAVTEMSATARTIAGNTTRTADSAQQANEVTLEGKRIMDATVTSTNALEEVINNASVVIQQLGDDSNSIGSILDVIRGIAEQTNLLALNAAIEAARAGEQGRGFAVVADEVRTLAQKTQDSISEIEAMITSLQSGSARAIEAITQGKESVSSNVEQINAAGATLVNIVSELDAINQMSHENASATEEQSAVAEEVNKNVVAIRDLGSQIIDNVEELKESSTQVGILSSSMEELVQRFEA